MSEQIKSATLVRDVSKENGAQGEMKLWHVSPPMVERAWMDGEKDKSYDHVITSAVVAMFSGPETYIFPATAAGRIDSWGELEGSFKGGLDHEEAIRGAGYTIAEVLVVSESEERKEIGA